MEADSVPKKNICESVLDNLTLKMTVQFVETSPTVCRTTQQNIRVDLGLLKLVVPLLLLLLLYTYLFKDKNINF